MEDNLKSLRVLVVDDSKSSLTHTKYRLERLGFTEIYLANGALAAIELFKEQRPDLVLSDIIMPDMLGTEMSLKLREIDPEIKIIFITASEKIQTEAHKHGDLTNFLSKPLSEEELIKTIIEMYNTSLEED